MGHDRNTLRARTPSVAGGILLIAMAFALRMLNRKLALAA
jgi:hypothetical protein